MWFFLACSAPESPPADTAVPVLDTAPVEDTAPEHAEDTGPVGDGWYGELRDEPWPVPEFTATAADGTPRGPEHLAHRTALWFFRDGGSDG